VHHLADSEMTAAVRLRFVVATDSPRIQGYDQDEFARRLHYDRPTEASLELFKAARRATAELMERMTEAEWSREGTHSEHGRYTLSRWLEIYADHAHKHAEQILVARDAARKKNVNRREREDRREILSALSAHSAVKRSLTHAGAVAGAACASAIVAQPVAQALIHWSPA
jgi:hypothetical protein